MSVRKKPFGSKRRSLARKQRNKLYKNGLELLEAYLPPVAPAEDYSSEIYKEGEKEREAFFVRLKRLLYIHSVSTVRNIAAFLGDFLALLAEFRGHTIPLDKDTKIAEEFINRINKDNNNKFQESISHIESDLTIGSLSGEPEIQKAISEAIFENVSLITNLNQKYFNDIQSMVFEQVGIKIGKPKEKKSRFSGYVSTRMEEPHVITLPEMIGYINELPTEIDSNGNTYISKGRNMERDVFDILKKDLPGIKEREEEKLKRRAHTIARDQTQKVFNALDTARGKDNGFVWYLWSASGGEHPDNRVRDTHRAHNGRIFHIDYPPYDTGAPGHDINCRCLKKFIFLKSKISKITKDMLGYNDAGQLAEVAKLLPGNKG